MRPRKSNRKSPGLGRKYPDIKKGSSDYWRNLAGLAWTNGDADRARRLEDKATMALAKEAIEEVRKIRHHQFKRSHKAWGSYQQDW